MAQPRTRLADIDRLAAAETALRLAKAVLTVAGLVVAVLVAAGFDGLVCALAWLCVALSIVLFIDSKVFIARLRRDLCDPNINSLGDAISRGGRHREDR